MIRPREPAIAAAPAGILAVGVFLIFGTVCALLAGITLGWHGTSLDRIWQLNQGAYRKLAPIGRFVSIPFLVLSATLAAGSFGWFRRRRWAWRLTTVVIATQVLGDLANMFMGHFAEGLAGVVLGSALFVYLLRAKVRSFFH